MRKNPAGCFRVGMACLLAACGILPARGEARNLLLNPDFEFHVFTNHRDGNAQSYLSKNIACWNVEAWGDVTVMRVVHAPVEVRPPFFARNMVSIAPGKKLWQFFTLPEAGLLHGDKVSLAVQGFQKVPGALTARVKVLKLDSEDGKWSPKVFGRSDQREFPRHARGELVVAKAYEVSTNAAGAVELKIDGAGIPGKFTLGEDSHSADTNTIALCVEFENTGKVGEVWVCVPRLTRGATAAAVAEPPPAGREMAPYYQHIPRTIQKLWKGEPIHILVMGSSIDRGSANPPPYLYDENPASPTFKQPIAKATDMFNAALIGRPELDGYFGEWRNYFSYGGRLKLELMRKFNLPPSKILLNVMAVDASCVGEAHSGLKEYCSLALPPSEGANGHKSGKQWAELYPELMARAEGPRPDLVIFGSGANEKTDMPDEVAVFEGMIRWLQRHYPGTEFLFCQFQNNSKGSYTSNGGDLQALALRYQIPYLDYDRVADDLTRCCNPFAFVPTDGHPQAAAHYVWFKQLEKAFECWDPIVAGEAQLQLPERIHANSYGWEGEMTTYDEKSGRIKGASFIFDDTAVNAWGSFDPGATPEGYVDGVKLIHVWGNNPHRDIRNSTARCGRCALGDRHVLELVGKGAKLTFVDAKSCPDRRFFGIDNALWKKPATSVNDFASEWGAPYGAKQILLKPGESAELDVLCTDISVAYVDAADGGDLQVIIDGQEKLVQPTNVPFIDFEKRQSFIENRKGVLGLGFGVHTIRIEAAKAPVRLLGLFCYDSRSNRSTERRLTGTASAGETIPFSLPFKCRPFVSVQGGLRVKTADVTPEKVTFSGEGIGTFEVTGE